MKVLAVSILRLETRDRSQLHRFLYYQRALGKEAVPASAPGHVYTLDWELASLLQRVVHRESLGVFCRPGAYSCKTGEQVNGDPAAIRFVLLGRSGC